MNLNKCHWRKWMLAIPLLAGLTIPALGASRNIAESRLANEGHRFLLVVETSKTMQRYGDAAVNAIHQLLGSDMQKQLRPGDSIGVWTYNDELYTGKLPSQEWNPTDSKVIYNRILKFIIEQKFEKTGSWHKALPTIARVVKDSQLITVILVSDGEEDIAGTPYDEEINAFYATWRDKQRKAQKPFITVFRGEHGKLTHYTICPVPWPVDIPALPPGRDGSQLAQAKAGQTKSTAQHIGKPLIVTGPPRKYEPIETPATTSATITPPSTAATVVAPSGQSVPSVPSAVLPQPSESTLVQPSTHPAPQPVAQTLAQPPAQAVVKDARQEVADMIISNLLAEAGKPQAQEPSTKVIVVGSTAAHSPTVAGTNHLNSAVNTGATSATTVSTVTKPATNALPAKVPEPLAVAKSQSAPEKTQATQPKATAPASASPTVAAAPRAPTKESAARSEGFFARRGTQNAALALAAGALACLFIAVRRPKPAYRPSIITRSLEREPR
jgi:hypothetical protein